MANIYFSTFILMFKTYLRCGHKFLLFFWITIFLTVWILENFVVKNLCDKVSKIKNLRWLFWRIFRWLCHSVLHFFCRHFFMEKFAKQNVHFSSFLKNPKNAPIELQISPPWKHPRLSSLSQSSLYVWEDQFGTPSFNPGQNDDL